MIGTASGEATVTGTAVRTQGLTRDFGKIRAVDDLTIEVRPGEIFGFLGPNGAGKTTTIHLLLGLLEPSAGSAEVLACDTCADGQRLRTRTGALLEDTGLYERLSPLENLEFYGRVWHVPARERAARSQELLQWLGLWDRRDAMCSTLSEGMRQKVAIARALFHHPELVFLDEPTSGLDVMAANDVRERLMELRSDTGTTIFLTTHNMREAERMCDRVAVVREGRLLAVDTPSALAERAGGDLEDGFLALMAEEGGAA